MPEAPKKAYVAYVVQDTGAAAFKEVQVEETDDLELEAILFAIEELQDSSSRFEIICDHQSVVSEVNRKEPSKARNPRLQRIRDALAANRGITLREIGRNLADKYLNEQVRALQEKAELSR